MEWNQMHIKILFNETQVQGADTEIQNLSNDLKGLLSVLVTQPNAQLSNFSVSLDVK